LAAPTRQGDYNDDGIFDAADDTDWHNTLAGDGTFENKAASRGTVAEFDSASRKENYGATLPPPGSSGVTISSPPPAAAALICRCFLSSRHQFFKRSPKPSSLLAK
jgi:hypothetical protein